MINKWKQLNKVDPLSFDLIIIKSGYGSKKSAEKYVEDVKIAGGNYSG